MSRSIKGITIEIGGDTSKLQKSLNAVQAPINKINRELKDVNQALKLDPKNTELLAQKQDILKRNIAATNDKLQAMKKAQQEMGDYSKLTDQQKQSYNRLSGEIAKSENALKGMNAELKSVSKADLSGLKDGLSKVGQVAGDVTKKMLQVSTVVAGALAGVVAKGVKSYAEYEQNLGGVETMFGKHADKVVKNAQQAYKTAGVSANEYMSGVTSFSASLLQSLGGDTAKAADVADMAFRDMSDNANKFGTDMSSIQNAYQGFAKQNYTMLDNLKLGYGGTKTEMERLLSDAEKLTGKKYDISNLSDVYNAIHAIQGKLGVTGTTADEAEKTISGSVNSMKAAFDNFLNGSGGPEELAETITNVLNNIGDAVIKLAPGILSGIVTLVQNLLPKVIKIIVDLVPQLLTAVTGMIDSLLEMVSSNTGEFQNAITTLIDSLITFITSNLPKIIDLGLKVIIALVKGIAESMPKMIPQIIQSILALIPVLIENIPLFIEAGMQLIFGLAMGLIEAIPTIIEMIPQILDSIITYYTENLPQMIKMGIQLTIALAKGIIQAIPKILVAVVNIIPRMVSSLKSGLGKLASVGLDMVRGIWNGINNATDWILSKIKGFGKAVLNGIKSIFKIKSPSRVMRDEIGKNLALGIGEGFSQEIGKVSKDMINSTKSLTHGINTSLNPLVNPNAINLNNQAMIEQLQSTEGQKEQFTAIINNNSKYTTPSDNVRLLRQQFELYNLKYGRSRG